MKVAEFSNLTLFRDKLAALTSKQGCQICHPKRFRFVPNGTNLGHFKISFSTFWLGEPKCTETDLK